ncbi:MAG: hypothetical protein WBW33_33530 [Bryobacteraceae bacterium]
MKTIRNTIIVKVPRRAVAIGFILTSAAAVTLGQNQSTPDDRGTIERRVREAKKLGKTSIKIGFPIVEHAETPPLDDALERTTLVLAKVLKSEVGHDNYYVVTWRKCRTLEKLYLQRGVYDRPLPQDLPAAMLPIGPDEFVIGDFGGTVVIDGVTVTMQDERSHSLPEDLPHLMFVLFFSSGAMAVMNYGPEGAFWVDDSDKIHAQVPELNPFGAEFLERTGGKLSGARTLCIRCK